MAYRSHFVRNIRKLVARLNKDIMQLITNQSHPIHRQLIKRLIRESDEIIVCVAFLKSSGLNFILDELKHKDGKCTFYVGTDYFLTEPNAVRQLLRQGHAVYKTRKSNSTFHPKIYYFKKGRSISILTGSANLTGGGLETNFEISLLIETSIRSKIYKDFKSVVDIFSNSSNDFSDELLISQYENDYEKYKQRHKQADREFNAEKSKAHKFDLSKLPKYVEEYKADKETDDRFENRTKKYKTAKKLLNEITRAKISSPMEFLNYYDEIATSYHSSGLLRGKKTLAKKYKTILSIFRVVQKNSRVSPKILFEKTLSMVKSVDRFGINALTELMNTYNPNKYSVANGRTLKSLSKLNFPKFPPPNNFDAETYEQYNNLITAIATKCNFENLGQVDHFLSWYYENYVTTN